MNARPDRQTLIEHAKAVLDRNWTGAFTKPAARLYPHQWSWDSAFIAMGYAHDDQDRAERELTSLFQGQWANGLLPHIVFNAEYADYEPGPSFWQAERSPHAPRSPQTSGIVQPPVHATAALHVYRQAPNAHRARAFMEGLFPRLRAWHAYLARCRDPKREGLIVIHHPWESGMDNSPLWDDILAPIEPPSEQIPTYRRQDIQLVDASERPSPSTYDRYAHLVQRFRERRYDDVRIQEDSPFLVQDVLVNALYCRANRDLARIAELMGEDGAPFRSWAERTADAMNRKLWNEDAGTYQAYDVIARRSIDVDVAPEFVPLFASVPDQARAHQLVRRLHARRFQPRSRTGYLVPSYSPQAQDYTPSKFWRGPVWINLDWLIRQGLLNYGFTDDARRIERDMIALAAYNGFFEHYDPESGAGGGAETFSWTAALLLDVLVGDDLEPSEISEDRV